MNILEEINKFQLHMAWLSNKKFKNIVFPMIILEEHKTHHDVHKHKIQLMPIFQKIMEL